MNPEKSDKVFSQAVFAGLTLFLFFYVLYRAYHLSFTHDEAASYSILFNETDKTFSANNHLLNTVLMGLFHFLFGDSELSLRFPNVLSFGFYLSGIYLILRQSVNRWLIVACASFLLFNPLLLDFFSLARGYGLSLGFMMMSIYFFLRNNTADQDFKSFRKDFGYSIGFATLALLSSFSTINFYIALLGLFTLQYIVGWSKTGNSFKEKKGAAIVLFLTALFPLALAMAGLMWLNHHNQLYFGELSLNGTLNSILVQSMYFIDYPNWLFQTIKYGVLLSLALGLALLVAKRSLSANYIKISLLMILVLVGLLIEHYLFQAKYPSGRTALVLCVIYGLFLFYFLTEISELFLDQKRKYIVKAISILIVVSMVFNFILSSNLEYTYVWKYDAHTKDIMLHLNKKRTLDGNMTLRSNWLFEPTIKYYIRSNDIGIDFLGRETGQCNSDFIYEFENTCDSATFVAEVKYDDIGTVLLARE